MALRAGRAAGKTFEATLDVQRIAFGPLMFQAARVLRVRGILALLEEAPRTTAQVAERLGLPGPGLGVLLDAGVEMGLVERAGDAYALAHAGHVVLHDEMTRIHMDFVHEVCWAGAFHLDEAVRTGAPAGFKTLGDWETLYHALPHVSAEVRDRWLDYDHYFSDAAFSVSLELVFAHAPGRLLDVGGNTGRWALRCVQHDPRVRVTILDLREQTEVALRNAAAAGAADRIEAHAIDLRDHARAFPGGFDAVWMSQFLDCFSEEDGVQLLRRGAAALAPGGRLHVLEPCWDRQPNAIGRYCLQAGSLYFICMASGRSRFFNSTDLLRMIEAAGLRVEREADGLGLGHTLFTCVPRA